jgi:hypothetical protein
MRIRTLLSVLVVPVLAMLDAAVGALVLAATPETVFLR